MTIEMPKCETCNDRQSIGVCCVPGMPVSAAYCQECLGANVHPWGYLVANAACCDGLENTADWFKEMVTNTCLLLQKTVEEFNAEVAKSIKDMNEKMEADYIRKTVGGDTSHL